MTLKDPNFKMSNPNPLESSQLPISDINSYPNFYVDYVNRLKKQGIDITSLNSVAINSTDVASSAAILEGQYTKKGEPRKRKKFEKSVQERKNEKINEQRDKHKLRPGCVDCPRKCKKFFSNDHRISLNTQYWTMNWTERRIFISSNVSMHAVQRRRKNKDKSIIESDRKRTFKYFLKNKGEKLQVCKVFFLTTLGYDPKNDHIITSVLAKQDHANILPGCDMRGKHAKLQKRDREVIKRHFESYSLILLQACSDTMKDSDSRQSMLNEQVQNKKSIHRDITIKSMHNHFSSSHPDIKCSYELYRSCVSKDFNNLPKIGKSSVDI